MSSHGVRKNILVLSNSTYNSVIKKRTLLYTAGLIQFIGIFIEVFYIYRVFNKHTNKQCGLSDQDISFLKRLHTRCCNSMPSCDTSCGHFIPHGPCCCSQYYLLKVSKLKFDCKPFNVREHPSFDLYDFFPITFQISIAWDLWNRIYCTLFYTEPCHGKN